MKINKIVTSIRVIVLVLFLIFSSTSLSIGITSEDTSFDYIISQQVLNEYTHSVLVEACTATFCAPCATAAAALHEIYTSGEYDFFYVSLVLDKNSYASQRCGELDIGGVPTYVFDGGFTRWVGASGLPEAYTSRLDLSGERAVEDIDMNLDITWNQDAEIDVDLVIVNNEGSSYNGHLHVYVTEIISRWNNYAGLPYHYAMMGDYAFNQNINVPAGGSSELTTVWLGSQYGLIDLEENNVMIIATLFNVANNNFVDQTVAALFPGANSPPDTPIITGPSQGTVGEEYEYTIVTIDHEEDNVEYYIDWGDGQIEDWIGPFESGEEVVVSHVWDERNIYTIRVKAKDVYNAESDWGTLEVEMPINRMLNYPLIQWFLDRFPSVFQFFILLL